MLKIFNELKPFFEDNYASFSIRDYAKKMKISPPTAAKLLNNYFKENVLIKNLFKKTHLFSANRSEKIFQELQKIYYFLRLKEIQFIDYLEETVYPELIILFGSAIKGELTKNSDLDLLIISKSSKKINQKQIEEKYEKKLNRPIQLFIYSDFSKIPKNLLKNVERGLVIYGEKN